MSGKSESTQLAGWCNRGWQILESQSQRDSVEEPEKVFINTKLSIRQYMDQNLMPTLLPALNALAKEK